MRFISSLDQHPEARKERFPEHLWPIGSTPKDFDEGWIFLEFIQAARLHLESAPTKLRPPMPDLECVINGKHWLFELGEILESGLAEGIAYSGKQAYKKLEATIRGDRVAANDIESFGARLFSANGSLERVLRKKLTTAYETNELPCQLILFYDLQRPWGPFNYLLKWQTELNALIAGSKFQRIWLFDLQIATVIGFLESGGGDSLAIYDLNFNFDIDVSFQALVPGAGNKPDEIREFTAVVTKLRGCKPLKLH